MYATIYIKKGYPSKILTLNIERANYDGYILIAFFQGKDWP